MPTLQAGSVRKLDYDFFSKPNPIRASEPGANPNTIDLRVTVSNPSRSIVTMTKIEISIPHGQEVSRDLTNSPDLPSPDYDKHGPWTITTEGGTVTIKPSERGDGQVIAPILFSLPGIVVNQTPGTVPMTITEFPPPPDSKAVDSHSYSLFKQPVDQPILSFTVTPATLDIDQPVTLTWTCSPEGKKYGYGLRADVQTDGLKACSDATTCYTWDEGASGIFVPAVSQTTTFTLVAMRPDELGHTTEVARATATARVLDPRVSDRSYVRPSASGRLVWLHWLALDATYCSVALDQKTIVERAPVNTHAHGYLVFLSETPGQAKFSVTAHTASGTTSQPFPFEPVTVRAPVTVPADNNYIGPAVVAPDGRLAVVAKGGRTVLFDLEAKQAPPTVLPTATTNAPFMRNVAITPDGALAFVGQNFDGGVRVIHLATRTLDSFTIPMQAPRSLACTPDGSRLLVGSMWGEPAMLVFEIADIAKRIAHPTPIPMDDPSGHVVITPDAALALVGGVNSQRTVVSFIDLRRNQVEATPLEVGPGPHDLRITSDGALALVALPDGRVRVIDVAARTVEPNPISIEGPLLPGSLAITPDGRWAFVLSKHGTRLSLIDIAARTCAPFADLGPNFGASCAISPTGSALIVLSVLPLRIPPGGLTLY